MRGKRQKESGVTCWHGGFRKQRILSVMLCAVLVVGTCVPEYSMSVHAANISDEEVIYDQEEENISHEEVYEVSDTAMDKSLTVTMSKTEYEAGSELKSEDLTVEYRGADGEIMVLSYQSDDSVSGYTMSGVDTDSPGVRTLTVSYNDGTDTLTATVDYTVYGVLTDAMVTIPDQEYVYIREEHKPEPVVKYADNVVLKPEEDYSVSYADNINAGEAAVYISGKGVYRGTVTKKFTIIKATFGEVNLSREESCWKATQGYWDLRGYFSVEAASDGGGFTGRYMGKIVEYNNVADGEDNVLAETPYIDKYGILRYSTKAGMAGDSVLIPIIVSFGKNYNDAKINITISLKDDGSASGTYEGITWKIDANRKLTVEGTGEFSGSAAMDRAPWYDYRDRIKSAEIRVTGMQNASYMFYGCSKLTSLDVSGFDMGSVTNMSHMFEDCTSLTSVDMSRFNTGNVTDMSSMFKGCASLTSLDLSDFDISSVKYANDMLSNCSSLSMIYTPCNVNVSIKLPAAGAEDVWYDSENKTYTDLPLELDHSTILSKNKVPDTAMEKKLTVIMSKVEYAVGSVIYPEDLTVKYRGADGKTTILYYKSDDSASGYTISGTDTNTLGDKVLTVSYNDGTDTLTETVNYTVYGILTDAMVTMPDQEYIYNREEQKPEPVVKYADDIELKPEEDYLISYTDNINAGEATVSISGKGVYRGTVTKKFIIQKATFGEVNLSWEESGWKAGTHSQDLSDYFSVEAASDGGGITGRSIGQIIEYNDVTGGEGNVLSKPPTIDESGILRYSTNVGTAGDSVLIPIILSFGRNYNDAMINVTVSLKDGISGTYEGITWEIDAEGKLTVEGTGEFSKATSATISPWYEYRKKIESAEIRVTGMQDAGWMFYGCNNLISIDLTGFDTSSVTSMYNMFRGCDKLTSLDLSGFDTSNVTYMHYMFYECKSLTDLNLSGLDTRNVTNMCDMFYGCSKLTSLNLSGLDARNVTNMCDMFYGCSKLTSLDLSGFKTSSVTNMCDMFYGCSKLTSLDLSGFDTSSVTNMSYMFYNCKSLTDLDLSGFNTSKVANMSYMFYHCESLTDLNLSNFDTGSVTNMSDMFSTCKSLTDLDLSRFNTSNVTDMSYMFYDCSGLTSLNVSGFNTSNVTNMRDMFSTCKSLTDLDLSGFDTSKVTDMHYMFNTCTGLTDLDLSSFDTSNVTDMSFMFETCRGLTDLNLSSFDTGSVTNMHDMFYLCENLTSLDLSGFDTSKVKDMSYMFHLCYKLTDLDLSRFDTSKVKDMSHMFYYCRGLTSLDLSNFDMRGVTSMENMFGECSGLSTLYTPYNIRTSTPPVLPAKKTDNWYDLEQKTYTELPTGLDYSIVLAKNKTPDATEKQLSVILSKYAYEIGSVIQPEDLTVRYRGTDGKTIRVSIKDDNNVSGYTISGADTDTPGDKTLTVSYNDGTDVLTAEAPFTVFKKKVVISADVKESITYNGSPVSPESDVTVRVEDENETDVTELVTILRQYTGTQEDGTKYDSDIAPIHAGHYVMILTVGENNYYEGSKEILFQISRAPLTITARDVRLVIGDFYALQEESLLEYDVKGLCGIHTAQDVMSVMPTVVYGLNGTSINRGDIAIDREGSYELIPSGAELNTTAGSDYEIQSYESGTLIISKASENPSNPSEPSNPSNPSNPSDPSSPSNPSEPSDPSNPSEPSDPSNPSEPSDPSNPSDPDDSGFPDDGKFRISKVPDQIYTGKAIKPTVIVYYGSRRLTEKADYTVAYKNNINANDAKVEKTAPTITVKGKGNYSGKQSITFVIRPRSIEGDDVIAADIAAAKNGKVQRPVPNLVINENNKNKKLKNKKDFIVSYPDENKEGAYKEAGTYTVTVTGTKNYTGTRNINFTITDKTLLSKAKITVKAKDYTGSAVTLGAEDITVKVGKATLTYGTDYTLSYRNNTQAGKATVIVTGTGDNYAGSKEAFFQIKGESIAKAQITGIDDKVYTGAAQTQNIQVQLNDKILKKGDDYTVSYAKEVNVGTATVIVTGKGGYTGTVKKSFKITAYDLQTNETGKLQGVPKNLTTAYTKGGATPAVNLTFNGKTLEAKKDYTVTYQNNKKPATASDAKAPTMIIKGKGNFKGTFTIPFAITVNNLETNNTVTITAADTAYVNKAGKYAVKPVLTDVNGKKLAAGTDYEKTLTYMLLGADGSEKELTTTDIVPAGSIVKVTVKGKGSYTGSISATYRITEASFSKAKIKIEPKTYTGGRIMLSKEDIKVTLGRETLTYGKDYTVVEDSYKNNVKKGRATVTVKGLNNYGGTKTVKFKITTRTITEFILFNLFKK